MLRLPRKRVKPVGAPPGTLVHTGARKTDHVRLTVIDYSADTFEEREIEQIEDCFGYFPPDTITWLNIDGLHDIEVIEALGEELGIHKLVLEDILYVEQRPKVEDYGDYLFVVLKMLIRREDGEVESEHISLLLGPNWIVSFQEFPGDIFENIRSRLRKAKGRIRELGADYLCYRLIDTIVDHYYIILDETAERVSAIEEELEGDANPDTRLRIYTLKHELLFLRKRILPLREAVGQLEESESPLVSEEVCRYLSDTRDHTFQVMETLDSYREMVSGLQDLYLSVISNRMNEVMKVLTIIATIFIPLTFIAGIYGMNFQFMPELGWRPGYFVVWGVMLAVAAAMIIYFKRKKWL